MYLRFSENTETRFVDESGQNFIEGYATTFDNVYYVPQEGLYERISNNAFDKSLASGQVMESRYNHSRDHVLGRSDLGSVRCWNDGKGIRYRVKYNPADPDHLKVKAKLESGLIRGSSLAMVPTDIQFTEENGKDVATIREAMLFECGPVNDPCNLASTVTVRSQDDMPTMKERYAEWKTRQEQTKRLLEIAASL